MTQLQYDQQRLRWTRLRTIVQPTGRTHARDARP